MLRHRAPASATHLPLEQHLDTGLVGHHLGARRLVLPGLHRIKISQRSLLRGRAV